MKYFLISHLKSSPYGLRNLNRISSLVFILCPQIFECGSLVGCQTLWLSTQLEKTYWNSFFADCGSENLKSNVSYIARLQKCNEQKSKELEITRKIEESIKPFSVFLREITLVRLFFFSCEWKAYNLISSRVGACYLREMCGHKWKK